MKLTYQTGIGTLIQFILLSLVTLVSQVGSVVTTCHKDSGNCISNLITSTILYVLVAGALGGIWLIGYAAQDRRSKRLAQLLICIEGLIALLALLSIKLGSHQHKNALSLIASFGVLVLAVWIISLSFRLMRAGGGRVVVRQRPRHPSD
jgi:peptidoglycan/LPS O-acetylase OafA/YrhL